MYACSSLPSFFYNVLCTTCLPNGIFVLLLHQCNSQVLLQCSMVAWGLYWCSTSTGGNCNCVATIVQISPMQISPTLHPRNGCISLLKLGVWIIKYQFSAKFYPWKLDLCTPIIKSSPHNWSPWHKVPTTSSLLAGQKPANTA